MKKILIIDDDADFTEAVSRVLQAKKYKTISASGGRQGFIKAQEKGVSLILLDVMIILCVHLFFSRYNTFLQCLFKQGSAWIKCQREQR